MNPYRFVISNLSPNVFQNLELTLLICVLELMSDAYSSGFVRGPGNNEYDYVVREIQARFGVDHIVSRRFVTLFGMRLGQ